MSWNGFEKRLCRNNKRLYYGVSGTLSELPWWDQLKSQKSDNVLGGEVLPLNINVSIILSLFCDLWLCILCRSRYKFKIMAKGIVDRLCIYSLPTQCLAQHVANVDLTEKKNRISWMPQVPENCHRLLKRFYTWWTLATFHWEIEQGFWPTRNALICHRAK